MKSNPYMTGLFSDVKCLAAQHPRPILLTGKAMQHRVGPTSNIMPFLKPKTLQPARLLQV